MKMADYLIMPRKQKLYPVTNKTITKRLTSPTIPAPMVTLHKLAYAPNREDFFSLSSSNGTSLCSPPTCFLTTITGRWLPLGVLSVVNRGLDGRKKGDKGMLCCGCFFFFEESLDKLMLMGIIGGPSWVVSSFDAMIFFLSGNF